MRKCPDGREVFQAPSGIYRHRETGMPCNKMELPERLETTREQDGNRMWSWSDAGAMHEPGSYAGDLDWPHVGEFTD